MKFGTLRAAAICGALAIISATTLGPATAATFQYDSYTVTNQQNIHIATPHDVSAGMGQIVLHGAGANINELQAAWCVDIYDFLTQSGTYTIDPLTTAGSGSPNPLLSTAQISEIGSLMVHGTALINTDTNVSAATQLAIWMVEYGNGFTYSGVASAVETLAQQYVAKVMGGDWDCPTCTVTLLSLAGDQNLGYGSDLTKGGESPTTPLPAALPLFASGLGALGLLGWRKKRKAQAAA